MAEATHSKLNFVHACTVVVSLVKTRQTEGKIEKPVVEYFVFLLNYIQQEQKAVDSSILDFMNILDLAMFFHPNSPN